MYDDCPDHGLPGEMVCASCVRPLCRKCKVKGTPPRCQECLSTRKQESGMAVAGGAGLGTGKIIAFVVFAAIVAFLLTMQSCPGIPKGLVWLK